MGTKSNYLEDAVLNVLRGTTLTGITPRIALYTATPGEATAGTEVSGNAYARVAVTFTAPSAGSMNNNAVITFPQATPSGWGTVTAWSVMDAATSGNLCYWGDVTPNKAVAALDTPSFASGALVVSED